MKRAYVLAVAVAAVALTGCHRNRLHEFDYSGRTLSVVSDIPARPEVLTGPLFIDGSGNRVRDLIRIGTRVVREVEARDVQRRLDEAARQVDVGLILEDRVIERAARYLGASPVEVDSGEDYLLELFVEEYGIAAEDWDATAYFYIEAEAALIEARTGEEIWRRGVDTSDPIGPEIWGPGRTVRNVVTAAVLADLSVEEIVSALESLADYAAEKVTDRLRDDLREAREKRRGGELP